MLLIPCPWCGPRDEIEFKYGGEAHIARPLDPAALSDAEWADEVFAPDGNGLYCPCRKRGPRQLPKTNGRQSLVVHDGPM